MPSPLRYVILHHTGIPDPHYDLMFERHPGGPLQTFRSPTWPITTHTPITPLPDHRRDYLDYEGPITNNRGHVQRIEGGNYAASADPSEFIILNLVLLERNVRLRLLTARPDAASIEPADPPDAPR